MRVCFLLAHLVTFTYACHFYVHDDIDVSFDNTLILKHRINKTGLNAFVENYVCDASQEIEHLYFPDTKVYEIRKRLCPELCQCEDKGKPQMFTYSKNKMPDYGFRIEKFFVKVDICCLRNAGVDEPRVMEHLLADRTYEHLTLYAYCAIFVLSLRVLRLVIRLIRRIF